MLEAIVIAAGVNPEGGTRNLRFRNRPTESSLHDHLRLRWRTRQRWAFFLRAETFFDMASAYEGADEAGFHERSHGQQFIDAANTKLQPGGLHLMDEPEAALSVTGQLSVPVDYEEAQPVTLTKNFLEAPERFFNHLFND